MQLLLIGYTNPLAQALRLLLRAENLSFSTLDIEQLDTPDAGALAGLTRASLVIDLSAMEVDVDFVRSNTRVTELCAQHDVPLLFVSGCDVFSGNALEAYRETVEVDGVDERATLLIAAESRVRACIRHMIVRPGILYSVQGENILTLLMQSWRRTPRLALSRQSRLCPTHVDDVARVIVAIVKQLECGIEPWGIYHYASADITSYYDFAEAVLSIVHQYRADSGYTLVDAGATDEYPPNLALNCRHILNTFGIKQRSWRSGLTVAVRALLNN